MGKMRELTANAVNKADRKYIKLQTKHETRYEEEMANKELNMRELNENLDKDGQIIQVHA